jgi:Asp-tRNA(Asn)/Glu-tRNA(Gln) amidotransferase A subunit family amidase
MTELCDLSASQLGTMIRTKEVSPVEIMESCIARTKLVDGALNAMVTPAFDTALAAARAAEDAVMRGDDLGLIHGLPVAVKDLDATAGIRTTYGSRLHRHDVPDADQGSVARIRAQGGIVLGKTNTPEFGAGGNTRNMLFGPTSNPFDVEKTCGGSSGGSAVALATGMAPLATGSDYGGSLRTPAGFCGIVGFRPSPGIVPIEDSGVGLHPFAVLGPMARCVDDVSLLLRAMMGFDPRDIFSSGAHRDLLAPPVAADPGRLRVAISADLGVAAMSAASRALFAERVELFCHHFGVVEECHPDLSDVDNAFEVLRGVGFVAAYDQLVAAHREDMSPNVIDNVERGLGFSVRDIATAHLQQSRIARNWLSLFDDFDVLICPVASVSPFPHAEWSVTEIDGQKMASYMSWLGIVYGPTMALACAVALPCGVDAAGMPFGIQLLGAPGKDRKLLEVAKSLEIILAENPLTARAVPDLDPLKAL